MDIPMQIIIVALNLMTTLLITGFYTHIKCSYQRLINELKLVRIDVQAMDYAQEMESENGYCDYRDQKRKELINNYNFINKVA